MNRLNSNADTLILDVLADKRQLMKALAEGLAITAFMVAVSFMGLL